MDEKASQFDKADSAVARLVDAFMAQIESMFGKLEPAYATYILERMLLILCHRMTRLLDDPRFAKHMGPATITLSNAMAEYRDSCRLNSTSWPDWRIAAI